MVKPQRYLQRNENLRMDALRWLKEIDESPRATLAHGILTRTCAEFELLIRMRLELDYEHHSVQVERLIQLIGDGKPVSRFTLGQCLSVLLTLDRDAPLRNEQALVDESGRECFWRVVRTRNEIVHGRIDPKSRQQIASEFLKDVLSACENPLLTQIRH
jgi:hypothetical protein